MSYLLLSPCLYHKIYQVLIGTTITNCTLGAHGSRRPKTRVVASMCEAWLKNEKNDKVIVKE